MNRTIPPYVSAVVAFVMFLLVAPCLMNDDAYITFQYAQRIATGHGFSYSADSPPTYGSTSASWTLLLALFSWLGFAPTLMAPLLGAIFHGGTAGLLYRRFPVAAWAYGLCAPLIVCQAGFETPLVIFLMTTVILGLHRPFTEGLVLGLLCITRPDAVLFASCFLFYPKQPRADAKRRLAGAALIFAPWTIYALVVLHTPVPESLLAKAEGLSNYGRFTLPRMFDPAFSRNALVGVVLALLWGASLVFLGLSNDPRLVIGLVWAVLYTVLMLNHAPKFVWYYVPLFWIGFIGFDLLIRRLRRLEAFATVGLLVWLMTLSNYTANRTRGYFPIQRQLAMALEECVSPGETIAAKEVGFVGYGTTGKIIDLMALVSPEHRRLMCNGHFDLIIRKTDPDWIVIWKPEDYSAIAPSYSTVYRIPLKDSYYGIHKRIRNDSDDRTR